jgi:hypothetical protein
VFAVLASSNPKKSEIAAASSPNNTPDKFISIVRQAFSSGVRLMGRTGMKTVSDNPFTTEHSHD